MEICSQNQYQQNSFVKSPPKSSDVKGDTFAISAGNKDNESNVCDGVTKTSGPCSPPQKKSRKTVNEDKISTSSEFLNQQAQELVDEINVKRKNDTVLLEDFKKAFEIQVENWTRMLEKVVFQQYERKNTVIQDKLQELYCIIDDIGNLERELLDFKQALSALYSDVQNPEP